MCQLAAYVGDRPVVPLLLDVLRLQEGYFGGQATGLATLDEGRITMHKAPGPVDQFKKSTDLKRFKGTTGIAHSRYSLNVLKGPEYNLAANAHPWLNEAGTVAMMHNGIINNYRDHWDRLGKKYAFTSYSPKVGDITDSEVALHLLDEKLGEGRGLPDALRETANSLTGMVLLAAMHVDEPEAVYVANWMQACTLAKGDGESMFTSSRLGLAGLRDELDVFRAPRNSLIRITRDRIEVAKLDPSRRAPDPDLDEEALLEQSLRILRERGEMDSVELLIALSRGGFDEAFHVSLEEWRRMYLMGHGDQNQIMEPLSAAAARGRIRCRVLLRREGGVDVPRGMWST